MHGRRSLSEWQASWKWFGGMKTKSRGDPEREEKRNTRKKRQCWRETVISLVVPSLGRSGWICLDSTGATQTTPPEPSAHKHTHIYLLRARPRRRRGGGGQMRVWVKVNNLLDGVKWEQKRTKKNYKTAKERQKVKRGETAGEGPIDFGKEAERAVRLKKEEREMERQESMNNDEKMRDSLKEGKWRKTGRKEKRTWQRERQRKTHLVEKTERAEEKMNRKRETERGIQRKDEDRESEGRWEDALFSSISICTKLSLPPIWAGSRRLDH